MKPALPQGDGVGDDIDDESSYVGLIKTAHWFVGIGCAAHQLPSTFYPSCAFDMDSTAMEVFLGSFPDVPTSTTLKEAMKKDSAFLREARESRVGFASPPCSQHTQANRRRDTYLGLHIMHPSAALVIDTIDALAIVQHEVMVIECVPGMTTACHGQLPIRMNKAADDAGYTITQHSLDPLALGGCQTRARIFVVLVRNDVSRNRGPFTIPTVPKGVQSRNLISILDPVADVMPANVTTTPTDASDRVDCVHPQACL
jgi:site-specific DNA-cytosine methylase